VDFLSDLKDRVRKHLLPVTFAEGEDPRVLGAADILVREGLVRELTLLGNEDRVRAAAKGASANISKCRILEPKTSSRLREYAAEYVELRKHKGATMDAALELMQDPLFHGAMALRKGHTGGLVAGAVYASAKVVVAAATVVKAAPGISTISSCFIMVVPESPYGKKYGDAGVVLFADSGSVIDPSVEQLVDIAYASAGSAKHIVGMDPVVAFLSFSTHGSASHALIDKPRAAARLFREKHPEIPSDGELQADAALVASVAKMKCPESPVGGRANVLIFPDLDAGNIGYKLVERLARAQAYGPILQGVSKPMNDLSRGCKAEDVVGTAVITQLQALQG
jgi:phosphate acetyltransferase